MFQIGNWISLPSAQYPQRNFKIIKHLGQGKSGVVYQVKPLDKNFYVDDVMIKIYNIATENEIRFIEQLIDFQNNEKSLGQDRKSQIIRIYEKTQYQGKLAIIMNLGEKNLKNEIFDTKKFLFLNDKIKILNQMAQSIWYLHNNQFIHRDLKPEHFYKSEDEFKLVEFNLAKFNEQKNTMNIESTLFQAPEMKHGSNTYTEAVDIWSLGGIFYEILTEKEFNPENFNIQNLEIRVPLNGLVNQYTLNMIKKLLEGMLQINPLNRLNINQVKQELTSIQNLIQQSQPTNPKSFPPSSAPSSPEQQQIPKQFSKYPPVQNVLPQQQSDIEKKIAQTIATQFSDQNSQITNLIMDIKDMFVERFEQQQKQISEIQNLNQSQVVKSLKENFQDYTQDLSQKIEFSISENIESQFKQIEKSEDKLRDIAQQQDKLIKKQEELLNFQTKQYQSFTTDIQSNFSTITTYQDGQKYKLDENLISVTQAINTFKENLQLHQQQLIEENQKNIQNFKQLIDSQLQNMKQLLIIDNQGTHNQQQSLKNNNSENTSEQSSQQFLSENNLCQQDQQLDTNIQNFKKLDKQKINIKNESKLYWQMSGQINQPSNEIQKQQPIKRISKTNIKQDDDQQKK